MADAKSNYAENLVAQWLWTTNSVIRPTAWYVALYTAAPSDAGGGTEVNGGSYARQSATFTVSGNTASNSSLITFTGMPDVTITHFGVFDAVSAGNLLAHGALTAQKDLDAGDTAQFAVSSLTIAEL